MKARACRLQRYGPPKTKDLMAPSSWLLEDIRSASAGAFGMVFEVVKAGDKPLLVYLAFGVRHHPPDSHADSLYRIAHRRLHQSHP